jgi:hypothetical protein
VLELELSQLHATPHHAVTGRSCAGVLVHVHCPELVGGIVPAVRMTQQPYTVDSSDVAR